MKYMLYCKHKPVDLGIQDAQGNWDMEKFLKHIRRCPECSRFISLLGMESLNILAEAYKTGKGGQVNNRPQSLNHQRRGERIKQWKAYH
ncbi:hypothetical protein ES705_15842 [subsurface metagenome]